MSVKKEQIKHFAIMEEKPNERRRRANSALQNHPGGKPNEQRKRTYSALHNYHGGEIKLVIKNSKDRKLGVTLSNRFGGKGLRGCQSLYKNLEYFTITGATWY